MSRGELNISRWLEAHSDRNAGLCTFPRGAVSADVSGDGDLRLVLTDVKLENGTRSRLKVYKGTAIVSDQPLPDIPCAVISFYTDNLEPRVPSIGVVCATELLIYKNNKPFYKLSVPEIRVHPLEEESWRKFEQKLKVDQILEDLKTIPFNELSGRSQELLSLTSNKTEEFANRFKTNRIVKVSPFVCATVINKYSHDENAIACPVLATENGMVYFVDPQTYTILHQASISNTKCTPVSMQSCGLYDVDYRLVIACRESCVCLLRRNWVEGKTIIQLIENIIDLLVTPGDNAIILATGSKTLQCYSKKGHKLWSSAVVNPISCLCLVVLKHLGAHLVAVGMRGGAVHLYHGRQMVDHGNVPDTPSLLLFGPLGQEENVLLTVTISGTIDFKILKRTADFNLTNQDRVAAPSGLHARPLPLPKRSKLFLEQSAREREQAQEMHQNFQRDLIRLRLVAARAMVHNLGDHSGAGNVHEQCKLSAQVLGIGPTFTLTLNLENMNGDRPIDNFSVIFHANSKTYRLDNYVVIVPLIPPSLTYKLEAKVTEVSENTTDVDIERIIRVFVNRKGQSQPILAAAINMPVPEYFLQDSV